MAETRLWKGANERREREVGGAKERDKEELSRGVCTLGPSGWLAGATVRRSRVVAAQISTGRAYANLGFLRSARVCRNGESAAQREW